MQRPAPLFNWQTRKEVEAVRARRADLAERIRQRPRHSHARIILEAQLQATTAELLRLEHDSEQPENGHETRP